MALKAFFHVVERWRLQDEDAKQLLGGVTHELYRKMKEQPENCMLDAEQLLRISYLTGIFKALNALHAQPLADEWVRLSSANRIFCGASPLDYMINGGIPAMRTVRRLLDAQCNGQ